MEVFVVHRTSMQSEARRFFAKLKSAQGIDVAATFLRKSFGPQWKQQAEAAIYSSEAVVVFDTEACAESPNARWEIEKAEQLGRQVIKLSRDDIASNQVGSLRSAYEFEEEFENCFPDDSSDRSVTLELYKIIIQSSEELIKRRQITNGFFITVIGAIVGASGFVVAEGVVTQATAFVIAFPAVVGLLLCRSWSNLISNFGKLNKAKFKVIHQLEAQLGPRIFDAEWVALGKGLRKEKYQSFTSTEQIVPRLFSYLIWAALVGAVLFTDWPSLWTLLSDNFGTLLDLFQSFDEGS